MGVGNMENNILKLKELLTKNYKMEVKQNYNVSNPNERTPMVIELTSPSGEKEELIFRDLDIDIIQGLVYQFN